MLSQQKSCGRLDALLLSWVRFPQEILWRLMSTCHRGSGPGMMRSCWARELNANSQACRVFARVGDR